jgi:choline dehydrogenase-like flavoprotein
VRHVDVLIVGSGAGGATTAATLAAAGVSALVLEEGPEVPVGTHLQFGQDQMRAQYRSRGQLVALGLPPITYAEGRCVGGSTEINSGLYHRPTEDLFRAWREGWDVDGLDVEDLADISNAVEANLHVSRFPAEPPAASSFLARGAAALAWSWSEVPRWYRYDSGQRQSMSATYLRFAVQAGVQIRSGAWVRRLRVQHGRAVAAEVEYDSGGEEVIGFDTVFVCGGAVQSAALLLRSGIRRNVGRTLSMHPTVKAVAVAESIEPRPDDVPVTQIREFAPTMTIGGSATNPPLLALALLRTAVGVSPVRDWRESAGIYYAAIRSAGRGRIRALPGMRDPLVTYQLPGVDFARLKAALGRLLLVLLAAGSQPVVPSVAGGRAVADPAGIADEVARMTRRTADVMTVHLCSSVPMGENRSICAVDSFGASHEVAGLVVNDASIVDGAPGINPQGTVMALAVRNAEHFLDGIGQTPGPREFA